MDQIAGRLEKYELIDREVFDSLCYDTNFIKSLGFSNINSLEGYLFPETYFFSPQKNEKKIIKMMLNQFEKIISKHLILPLLMKTSKKNQLQVHCH